jgi:alpha-glucuronidase
MSLVKRDLLRSVTVTLCFLFMTAARSLAKTGEEAWLRYAPLDRQAAQHYSSLPLTTITLGNSVVSQTAQLELVRGVRSMLARSERTQDRLPDEPSIVLATLAELQALLPELKIPALLQGDGYWLSRQPIHGFDCLVIAGASDRGVLYGVFDVLRRIALDQNLDSINEVQQPYVPLRWVNQWDNLDGSIERGYGGASIFFANGKVRDDLKRAREYARILASLGMNGCVINNVNADPELLSDAFLPQLARIAGEFRPWGVRIALAVDLSSPKAADGLNTFDPLDSRVAEWWRRRADQIYRLIPDFGGFVMKADSEGRAGPAVYGRTAADAANVIARSLKPHTGVLFYRAFVYDHHLDWRDLKADRARAALDIFHPLDGRFDDNVIIQIKYGPIDFQVREPVSPLLGGLRSTNEALELQITQEYTGQQRHLCFLVPMWKEILDFDLHVDHRDTPVRDLVAGRIFKRPLGGVVGVANVGMDADWLGNPLALANLYGFGRLAWDPQLSPASIIDEWTRMTFSGDSTALKTITAMQLDSWHTYESYTGPLGVGTLTNILGNHYDSGPESSERNGWGQWHRADHQGIGMDRTMATGTGFIGQYSSEVQALYESVARCPDNLLLFFHHVPYSHVLQSGKSVIQFMYDSHYEGAERVRGYVTDWGALKGHIDNDRYEDVLAHLQYQAGQAVVWRDAICRWLFRLSGIADEKGRVSLSGDRKDSFSEAGKRPAASMSNAASSLPIQLNDEGQTRSLQ